MSLGQICTLRAGSVFKTLYQGRTEGDFPFIKVSDMNLPGNQCRIREANHWIDDGVRAEMRAKPFPKGTSVFAKIGAALLQNRVRLLVRDTIIDNNMMGAIPNSALVDPQFFFYRLSDFDIAATATGTALPYLTISTLARERFPIPPLAEQRRIAGILTAYDDLIENSQRRIQILEAMARALYREWFVEFRFRGHERIPRVASTLGDIPQGWEVTTLRAVTTKIGSGATPRGGKESYKADGISLIRSLNIYDYRFEIADLAFIDEQQAAGLDHVTVEENDILLNITGASVARCTFVPSYLLPARVNQHVAIVRADSAKASPFYILDTINSDQRKQQLLALAQGGATREALTKDTVSNFEIVLPPRSVMDRYGNIAKGIHKQREVLQRQVQHLRRTRELLLPRLLSGQITLADTAA